MNGTVAVTSTIVQPVNIDTLKTAIDFSGNGRLSITTFFIQPFFFKGKASSFAKYCSNI